MLTTHVWLLLAAPVCMTFALRGPLPAFVAAAPAGARAPWPVVLGASACVSAAVALSATSTSAGGALAFLCVLARLAVIDVTCLAIPVRLTMALAAAGIVFAALIGGLVHGGIRLVVALLAWAGFRLLDAAFAKLRGRSGLGAGDALIAAAIGAWLGPFGLAWTLVIAGLATLGWAATTGRLRAAAPVAFAPGLAVGAFGALIGQQLLIGEAWTW
jgi:leader peptidase (prepilin peptidase) / N-methyltransferase